MVERLGEEMRKERIEKEQREDREREKREKIARDKRELRRQFEEEEKHHHLPLLVVQLPQGTSEDLSSRLDSA